MHFINSVQERHLILKKWNLKSVHEYRYLEHTKSYPIDGVDDAQGFHIVKEALDEVNVSKENQENTFSMLAAVLWLGNITLSMSDDENHVVPLIDKACLNYHKIGNGK